MHHMTSTGQFFLENPIKILKVKTCKSHLETMAIEGQKVLNTDCIIQLAWSILVVQLLLWYLCGFWFKAPRAKLSQFFWVFKELHKPWLSVPFSWKSSANSSLYFFSTIGQQLSLDHWLQQEFPTMSTVGSITTMYPQLSVLESLFSPLSNLFQF